jgi:hypothetical protein
MLIELESTLKRRNILRGSLLILGAEMIQE